MTEPLVREEIVSLLDRLGNSDDQEVLAAARALHDKVAAAGRSWDELLRSDGVDESEAAPAEDIDETTDDSPQSDDARAAETLRLIEALLAKSDISADFREELEGYKADMAEGEFDDNDHRYVRAVYKRLNG